MAASPAAVLVQPATVFAIGGLVDWWIGRFLDCWTAGLLVCWTPGYSDY